MNKFLLMTTLALGFSSAAKAGLLIEPYMGYAVQAVSTTAKVNTTTELSGKTSGLTYGARLGYMSFVGLWLAVDPQMQARNSYQADVGSVSTDISSTHLWADVGFDLPFLLRIWGGYAVSSEMNLHDVSGGTKATGSGGMKVGLGLTPLPFVSLNFEYLMNKYDHIKNNTVDKGMDDVYTKFDDKVLQVTVSIPLTL